MNIKLWSLALIFLFQVGFSQNVKKKFSFANEFIGGKRKTPGVFTELKQAGSSLDEILYLRRDFNDFHQNDYRHHPNVFFEAKTRKNSKK